MKAFARGIAVLLTTAVVFMGIAAASPPQPVKDKTVLTTDTEKASYMVGFDISQSIAPVAPDLDIAAFERAIKNAFEGGKPLLTEAEAKPVAEALMKRIASRKGQAPADGKVPVVAKDKVGYLVGSDVGRSLVPIKDELELPVLVQAVRTGLAKGTSLLSESELNTVRQTFSQSIQTKMQAKAAAAAEINRKEGADFLAKNKTVKGVFSTGSGLQYMVLRQGAGARPKSTDMVRVNYHGTMLDGKVFDSSY
ncbi:MAG: FKBP-type peptidyl-prolyl cis-trans isomerase N-terminal domain-containing protein, partial [Lysobacter sp.]